MDRHAQDADFRSTFITIKELLKNSESIFQEGLTLTEFLDPQQRRRNAWVICPGFKSLYVRKGPYCYTANGQQSFVPNSIQLANITARYPGKGAFTQLIRTLREKYPEHLIVIENVHEPRFARYLERNGYLETTMDRTYVL